MKHVLTATLALATVAPACGARDDAATSSTHASESAMPSSTSTSSAPAASARKDLVVRATTELFVDKDVGAIDRYWAEPYLQHNPLVASGVAAFRGLIGAVVPTEGFRYQPSRVLADGDLVAVHGVYTGFGPTPLVAFDIFRVDGGKIVEHWDAMQPVAGPNPSGHTMIDGPTTPRAGADTAASRALVTRFVETILVRGDMAQLAGFFAGDAYVQHNPMVADGLSGLGEFVARLQRDKVSFRYHKIHRVVAEGDLVLTVSEGELGGAPQAFYDLFRVEAGVIAEHWDIIQPVPATTASGLPIF